MSTDLKTTDDWRPIWDRSKANRHLVKVRLGYYALVVYAVMVTAAHLGLPWLSGPAEPMASLFLVFFVRWLRESRGRWKVKVIRDGRERTVNQVKLQLHPRYQSWAFLADTYGLVPMVVFGTLVYRHLPSNTLFTQLWYVWALAVLPVGAWLASQFARQEGAVYDVLRRNSWSKLCHNGVAFTVLSSMMLYLLIPIIFFGGFSREWLYSWLTVGGFILWLLSAAGDGRRGKEGTWLNKVAPLLADNLHWQTDEAGYRIYPEIPDVPMWNDFKGLELREAEVGDVLHAKRWGNLVATVLSPLAGWARRLRHGEMAADQTRVRRRRPGDETYRRPPRADDEPNDPG